MVALLLRISLLFFILKLHDKATMQDERVRLLSCLGSARSPALLQRLFNLAFSDYVRKQDRYHVLLGVTGSAAGRRALWNLVQAKIATLEDDLATTAILSYVLQVSWTRSQMHSSFLQTRRLLCL